MIQANYPPGVSNIDFGIAKAQPPRPPKPAPSVFDEIFRDHSGEFVHDGKGKGTIEFDFTFPRGSTAWQIDDAAIDALEDLLAELKGARDGKAGAA